MVDLLGCVPMLTGAWYIMKMSSQLGLFHDVPAGTIERLFDEKNQPLFERAD